MHWTNFNRGWLFCKEGVDQKPVLVNLPHDAMLYEQRNPGCENGAAGAFFPGGKYRYTKKFAVPDDYQDRCVFLEFEGIYKNSEVYVNGQLVGGRPYGYSDFYVSITEFLQFGRENEIRVLADNSNSPNSRWYSGSGIYSPVWLVVGNRTHIALDGIKIVTRSISPTVVEIETAVTGGDSLHFSVNAEISLDGKIVAAGNGARQRLEIKDARLWSAGTPILYDLRVCLLDGDTIVDEVTERFGLRVIEFDAQQGLRINGKVTKLRGACIHSDNGILGACSFGAAEERRIRILKEAGFNAIRSAHNPLSKAALRACDQAGMYVMDETFDMWTLNKIPYDYSLDFEEWHNQDIEAMVRKDFNHPSVILYSIGNEVSETAQKKGIALAGEMTTFIHALDQTRPVTAGINLMLNGLVSIGRGIYKEEDEADKKQKPGKKASARNERLSGSAFINMFMNSIGRLMNTIGRMRFVDRATRGVFGALDIAGYNYGRGRYTLEGEAYPDRVVVGSETFPPDIFDNWQLVKKYPYLIGDFMWTGWDYLGEGGLGAIGYESRGGIKKGYPYLTADTGVIDITGQMRPEVFYNQVVWGDRHAPYIGVEPLTFAGQKRVASMWRKSDARASWSWAGCDGKKAVIRVYSDAHAVELLLNGKSLVKKRVKGCIANFKTAYEKGELVAAGYDEAGKETGRCSLVSAGDKLQLAVKLEKHTLKADGEDLAYLQIELADDQGIVESGADRKITVNVAGAGTLQGFGSANPHTAEGFVSNCHDSFFGRALAVIRSGFEKGQVTVTVSADGLECREIRLDVE